MGQHSTQAIDLEQHLRHLTRQRRLSLIQDVLEEAEEGAFERGRQEGLRGIKSNPRPRIICLCGSCRFKEVFESENARLTLLGAVVLMPGSFMSHDEKWKDPYVGRRLDALHFFKIELADEVRILNVGGYIGDSTREELKHAMRLGKIITMLEEKKV